MFEGKLFSLLTNSRNGMSDVHKQLSREMRFENWLQKYELI